VSDVLLGGLLPRRWHWDPAKVPWIQIVLNWQDIELDDRAGVSLPVLQQLTGHRRCEVMNYCVESFRDHWDEKIARSIYAA
jgi:hypothetical protein